MPAGGGAPRKAAVGGTEELCPGLCSCGQIRLEGMPQPQHPAVLHSWHHLGGLLLSPGAPGRWGWHRLVAWNQLRMRGCGGHEGAELSCAGARGKGHSWVRRENRARAAPGTELTHPPPASRGLRVTCAQRTSQNGAGEGNGGEGEGIQPLQAQLGWKASGMAHRALSSGRRRGRSLRSGAQTPARRQSRKNITAPLRRAAAAKASQALAAWDGNPQRNSHHRQEPRAPSPSRLRQALSAHAPAAPANCSIREDSPWQNPTPARDDPQSPPHVKNRLDKHLVAAVEPGCCCLMESGGIDLHTQLDLLGSRRPG